MLGATGTSGRIAAQLATRLGARVVVAGRNGSVLDRLVARGADAAIGLDRPHDELAAAIAAAGPYDVVIDYLWGAPAEAVFAALAAHRRSGDAPTLIRYVQVGMSAGDSASVPAITLRAAPVQLSGSGIGGAASLDEAAAAYDELLVRVEAGEIVIDVDAVPLSEVEEAWTRVSSDRRVVFVP